MGTNITHYNGVELQHSRNMVIVRRAGKLSLINTVRLTEAGLAALDGLGQVENVIKIGAFHGRDDAFYLDRYKAKLWTLEEMQLNGQMPFSNCSLFLFETSIYPEGALLITEEGGILVTCDSIKNWLAPDEFFSKETADLYKQQGFFGAASISNVWKQACQVKAADFARLKSLKFLHLLSAHGDPLLNNAHELISKMIKKNVSG
jgi:hypothetical protein